MQNQHYTTTIEEQPQEKNINPQPKSIEPIIFTQNPPTMNKFQYFPPNYGSPSFNNSFFLSSPIPENSYIRSPSFPNFTPYNAYPFFNDNLHSSFQGK